MKTRILLLETDKLLARNLTKLLENKDREVDWQVDPQEAISSMDERPVDLIITELMLAGRSGVEFLYEVRSYPDWQNLPAIIYTGVPLAEAGFSIRSLELFNIVAYHCKTSSSAHDLLGAVEACLTRTPA